MKLKELLESGRMQEEDEREANAPCLKKVLEGKLCTGTIENLASGRRACFKGDSVHGSFGYSHHASGYNP